MRKTVNIFQLQNRSIKSIFRAHFLSVLFTQGLAVRTACTSLAQSFGASHKHDRVPHVREKFRLREFLKTLDNPANA